MLNALGLGSMRAAWSLAWVALVGCAPSSDDAESSRLAVLETSGYTLTIDPGVAATVDAPFVRREVEAAIALYRSDVAVPSAPLSIAVGSPGCLRTGYDFTSKAVVFCNRADTPRSGTASADVIHHEVFHALLCQSKPAWCDLARSDDADSVALHEGLADFFAYGLAPDAAFGEGFYRDRAAIRRYRVALCYSLVAGGHEKGNAISAQLIARGHRTSNLARFVTGSTFTLEAVLGAPPDDTCFTPHAPEVTVAIAGYPPSSLNRYRITQDRPLELTFAGDAAFQQRFANLAVRWEPAPVRFAIEPIDGATSFRITSTGTEGFDKVTASYVVDDEVVGAKTFYFQIASP